MRGFRASADRLVLNRTGGASVCLPGRADARPSRAFARNMHQSRAPPVTNRLPDSAPSLTLQLTVYVLRLTAHSSLFTAYSSRLTAHSSRFTVYCLPFTVHGSQFTIPLYTADIRSATIVHWNFASVTPPSVLSHLMVFLFYPTPAIYQARWPGSDRRSAPSMRTTLRRDK